VEFEDLESLKTALSRNGESFLDRQLRIDVAEAKPEERSPAWKNRSDRSDRSDRSKPYRSYPSNNFHRANSGDIEEQQQQESRERPKINLKPRSDSTPKPANEPDSAYQSAKFNPFGEAKPRDENFFLKKIEDERKKRGDVDDKKPGESDNEVSSPRSPRTEKDEIPKTDDVKDSPPPRFNHEKQNRSDSNRSDRSDSNRRDPQKRDDKFKRNNNNINPENKPFVRGSKSQDKGGFRKEDRNPGRDRDRPRNDQKREDRPRVEKVKEHIESKTVDVTSKNLFSALTEDEE